MGFKEGIVHRKKEGDGAEREGVGNGKKERLGNEGKEKDCRMYASVITFGN